VREIKLVQDVKNMNGESEIYLVQHRATITVCVGLALAIVAVILAVLGCIFPVLGCIDLCYQRSILCEDQFSELFF
jgi:hypothetical protein